MAIIDGISFVTSDNVTMPLVEVAYFALGVYAYTVDRKNSKSVLHRAAHGLITSIDSTTM